MPGFPNFFCLYGPGTNFGHGGSIIFLAECQIRFILSALGRAQENAAAAIEIRQDANDSYRTRLESELADMVWSRPNVGTYYKNARGIVTRMSLDVPHTSRLLAMTNEVGADAMIAMFDAKSTVLCIVPSGSPVVT